MYKAPPRAEKVLKRPNQHMKLVIHEKAHTILQYNGYIQSESKQSKSDIHIADRRSMTFQQ